MTRVVVVPALLAQADVVFTGGFSIWEAKASRHDNIHPFPSSVDAAHFRQARTMPEAGDQAHLPRPRLGYYGVIDELLDLDLIGQLAKAHPEWSIVMIGPVAKIAPEDLPRAPNIHWLGQRHYDELPAYLAGWDVALMPFALNEATRFISPTKTPEYLAGGRPVVSTPVRDVQRHYGDLAAVHIAEAGHPFLAACDAAMAQARKPGPWRAAADRALANLSWDSTQRRMADLVSEAVRRRVEPVPVDRFPAPGIRRGARRYDVTVCGAGFAGAVLAERLAEGLRGIEGIRVRSAATNIVFADVAGERGPALLEHLQAQGILATGLIGLRFVTHLDVDAAGIDRTVAAVRAFFDHSDGAKTAPVAATEPY